MKHLFSMGLAGFFLIIALLGFWRVHVARAAVEAGVLSGQVDELVAAWKSKGVAEKDRSVDIVIGDAAAGADVFALVSQERTAWERLGDWASRTFLRRSLSAPEPGALAKAFAEDPAAAVWTHEGFATVSETEMLREIVKAVEKAHDAGAEINIVAQGASAAPVLQALKSLEGVERGCVKVGANKVVLLGWDPPRLKRIPGVGAYDFTKLGNVIELANIWTANDSFVKSTKVRVWGRGGEGVDEELEKLWPELAAAGRGELVALVKGLVTKVAALEQSLARQEQALQEAAAKKAAEAAAAQQALAKKAADEAAAREAEARKAAHEAVRQAAVAEKAVQEAAKKEAAAQKAAEVAARKQGKRPSGAAPQGASQGQKDCSQCCADVGGSWSWGPETGDYSDDRSYQAKYGCCNGADYNDSVPSCRAAYLLGCCSNYHYRFRCARQ